MRHLSSAEWPLVNEFSLPPQSTVVVVGSYEGAVMDLISRTYNCRRVIGFDPQVWACARAMDRFSTYLLTECEVHPWALGMEFTDEVLYEYGTDAASLHRRSASRDEKTVAVAEMLSTFRRLSIDNIDLMIMNCEGAEFELLPYMMGQSLIPELISAIERVNRLAVQFHLGLGNDEQYDRIIGALNSVYPYRNIEKLPSWGYWYK